MAYTRNPRKRVVRGSSVDELRQAGRRPSEELTESDVDMPFVNLAGSIIGTFQDVVKRVGNAIIGGDFGGNARGNTAIDIQIERFNSSSVQDVTRVASGSGAVLFGRNSRAAGNGAIAVGVGALADGDFSVALGQGNAAGAGALAVNGSATGDFAVAVGGQADASGNSAIAIGEIAVASGAWAIAVGGNETRATGLGAIAMGSEARGEGDWTVAIGDGAGGNGARSIAIGYQPYTNVDDQAVIAATSFKMQTSRTGNPVVSTYESVITTSEASPVTGNRAKFLDVDRVGDAGVAAADLGSMGRTWMGL